MRELRANTLTLSYFHAVRADVQSLPAAPTLDLVVLTSLLLAVVGCSAGASENVCGLQGKVKIVEHHADYKVKFVEHFPDLKVQFVEHFPDDPGKWKLVEHHADFTIQIVEHHEDFRVQVVEHFPGC